MRPLLLITLLALPVTPALADITVTNDRGGSAVISRDCSRGGGNATCTVQSDFTGAKGKTAESKCGEGKCGENDKSAAVKDGEKKESKEDKTSESKCGEGKCG